jgi:hypothetical protein
LHPEHALQKEPASGCAQLFAASMKPAFPVYFVNARIGARQDHVKVTQKHGPHSCRIQKIAKAAWYVAISIGLTFS